LARGGSLLLPNEPIRFFYYGGLDAIIIFSRINNLFSSKQGAKIEIF
jgi:hypothetical protein